MLAIQQSIASQYRQRRFDVGRASGGLGAVAQILSDA
jgi:hypothetical protein